MTNDTYILAKISFKWDRGTRKNTAHDLGLSDNPEETSDGGLIKSLGTHYRSEDARERAKEAQSEAARHRNAIRAQFAAGPLDSTYLLSYPGEAQDFVDTLETELVEIRVSEFEMKVHVLAPADHQEWSSRIKEQLEKVPLGKGSQPSERGLDSLKALAQCPSLESDTQEELLQAIEDAREALISRSELKDRIADMAVRILHPDTQVNTSESDPLDWVYQGGA